MNAFDEQWRKKKKKEDELIHSESSGGSDDFDTLWKKKPDGSFPEVKREDRPSDIPSQETQAEPEKKDERGFFEKAKDTLLGLFGSGKNAEDEKKKTLDAISTDQGTDEEAKKPNNVQLKDDEYVKTVGTVAQMLKETEDARIKAEEDLKRMPENTVTIGEDGKSKVNFDINEANKKKNEIANLKEAEAIYRDFLGKDTEDNGFFRGIVDSLKNPAETLLPFAKATRETSNLVQTKQILDKYKNGEDLDDYEKSVVQTFKAKMIDGFIDRGLGYNVGNMLVNMPAYMMEFAMTAGTFKVGKAAAEKAVEKVVLPEIAKKVVSNSVGAIAQGSIMIPRISAGMAENMLPSAQLAEGEDGSFNVDIIQDGDSWNKALGKSYLSTVIDTASERVGSVVEKPMEFIQKATLSKWAKLRGLKSSKELNDLANKVGWNGIVGEVFEEEIGEMAQAPVEERDYNAPLLTPEGTQRLLVETLGITAFSGIAKVTDASIKGVIKYREKNKMDDVVDIPVKSDSKEATENNDVIGGENVINTLPDVIKQEFGKKDDSGIVETQDQEKTDVLKPVSNKYFTASKSNDGKMSFKEVDAAPVKIMDNVDTFIEKNEKGWGVREGRTGTLISKGYFQTKDEAIENTRSTMESAGLEKVQENINSLIQKHGESPRYSKVEKQKEQEKWPVTSEEYDASIEKRIEKFRKESKLMADSEGAGVRLRNVEDAAGNTNFVAKDFSLNRAKGDMKRRADGMKQYARELLYENDEEFRRMVDERDALREKEIDESDDEIRVEDIFGELSRQEEEINRNIEQYEAGTKDEQGTTQEDKGPQGEGKEKVGISEKEQGGKEGLKNRDEKESVSLSSFYDTGEGPHSKKSRRVSKAEMEARDEMMDAVSFILFNEEKWNLIIRKTGQGMTDYEDFGFLHDLRNDLDNSKKVEFNRIRKATEILAKYNLPISDMLFPVSSAAKVSITTNILNKLGERKTVSKQFISDLTNSGDVRQVERDLIKETLKGFGETVDIKEFKDEIQSQLLPLNTVDSKDGEPVYDYVALTDDVRGDVAHYYESIYESPIATKAGLVHFDKETTKNYFAHTRTEDMSDGKTRRIIEVQSDLFQKGRLEQEAQDKLQTEIARLEAYRNIWWERIIREELKKAAEDGKSVLLFPTGETAMKIEGLAGKQMWAEVVEYKGESQLGSYLKPNDLKVGKHVSSNNLTNDWIITDILGDGKFKAIPKRAWENRSVNTYPTLQSIRDEDKETFDVSGKVDANNPIYKFYEKDIQKFLKRIRPDFKTITDENGITWFETSIVENDANNPVLAFYDASKGLFSEKSGEIARGVEEIKGRLKKEIEKGGLKREEYDILETFVDRMAKNLSDVGLRFEDSGEGQGVFNYADAVVTLFKQKIKAKDAGMPRVMIHELWHSISRYLPERDLKTVNRLFERERKKFSKKHPEVETKLEAIRNGSRTVPLSNDEMKFYRYLNVDEFFAETMTDHSIEEIGRGFDIEKSHPVYRIIEHLKRVIRAMIESVADALGYSQAKTIFKRFYSGENGDMIHWLSFDLRNNELMKEEDPMRKRMVLVWSELMNAEDRLTRKGKDLLEKFNRREADEKDVAFAIDTLKEIGVDAEVSMRRYIETKLGGKDGNVKTNLFSLFQDVQEARNTVEEKNIKAVEFPELVALARKLTGKIPEIKKLRSGERGHFQAPGTIRLDADIFKDPVLAAKVLAHEIGHLADYLPDHNLSKGNVVARIASLKKFMKKRFGELDDKVLRGELYELSKEWRPFDEASASQNYMRYRKSAAELYADAISALFNQPELLKQKAPHFWRGFFDYMDEKPEVKSAFFDAWELLTLGEEAVLKSRQERIHKMFSRAEDEYTAKNLERKQMRKNYWFRFRQEFIDVNHKLIDKVREAEKRGEIIKDEDNPEYLLNENNYIGGEIKAWIEEYISPIYRKLTDNDITWEDFGQMLFLERVVNERGDLANPLGFQKATAEAQLEYLKKVLGEGRFSILEESTESFRDGVKSVLDVAETSGIYSKDVVEKLRANPAYATYQVVDYLDLNLPAGVRQQKGTLKDIANPATATVMKTISVIRATERNMVKGKTIAFLNEHHSGDIKPAKTIWNGKSHEPIPSKNKDEELLMVMEEGKLKGYYVDPYIADSFDYTSTGGMNVMIRILQFFNSKYFKPMYVVFNLGFQSFNFTRDFFRFYKNMPTYNPFKAAILYLKAVPASFKRAAGITDDLILEMEKKRVLSITYNDLLSGSTEEDKQIDRILEGVGVSILEKSKKKKWQKLMYPFVKVFGLIRAMGDFIETLPKVAGYMELKNKMPEKEMANFIRTSIGSPDFLRKGKAYPFYNNVFLFANAIKEGVRADYNVAIRNPKTRSGYWVKTAIVTILPKLAMLMALYGLFGDDEKERLEDVSEYDLTNYLILTLFRDDEKTTYLRIPQDETGRLIGGLFWKFMQLGIKKDPEMKDATDILAYTGGQIPSASPIIDLMVSTFQYMNGKNPYDYFRGQTVVPDEEFKAGGMYAFKPYAFWVYNKLGLNNIYSISLYERPGDEKKPLHFMKNIPVIGNAMERWIKTSDAGQREKNREIIQNLERDAARQRLEDREKINEKIKEYKDGDQSIFRRRQLTRDLVKDILGHPARTAEEKRKADNIDKKFRWGILRGEADSNIDSILNSNTNDEKVSVLVEIRKKKSEEDFSEFIKYLKMNKVVSENVIKELRKKK